MDALIIAAGFGSRLRPVADPKPLAPILDLSLIEIGIRQVARAGAQRAVVVTGYRADVVEAALPAISEQAGIPVVARRIDDWRLPNGYSVIAGASLIAGNYLLVMADHIFADPILPDLAVHGAPNGGVTLAIDRRTRGPLIDPEDATWVDVNDRGYIRRIGKDITSYCAVDCGAFLATPALAPAIAAAIADGRPGSLSDGMQRLADLGRAATMDIGESWWIDVDDPRTFAQAQVQIAARLPHLFHAAGLPLVAAAEARPAA
jgi:1L-myo-inositol 1-phosphate cytidylyltransferase